MAKGAEPMIRAVAEICRDLWGSHHHASQPQTTMLHDPKCRFDYPLAPVRLHHAGLVSLECPSRTPINTKLRTTFNGFKHQNQKPPKEQIIFSCAGAPSLLSPHSPHISYDRRSLSNVLEHRLKPTTNTTTKRPCSSGHEPDCRDSFLTRPLSFD
ncbi:hypothetical protein GBA52_014748 [Prunus armeniaca]|nr:hypothetical protein GBA52_014748 [Prunus armeniaca]